METSQRPNKMAKHKLELSDKPSKKSSSTNNISGSSSSTNTSSLSESSGGDSPEFNAAASNNNTYNHVQQFSSNEYGMSYHYPMSQGTFAPSYDHHIHHHHNHNHTGVDSICHQQSSTASSASSSETSLQQPCAANSDSGAFFR